MTDADNYLDKARMEQAVAELSEAEFAELVERTRPPAITDVKTLLQREMQRQGMTSNAPNIADVGDLIRQHFGAQPDDAKSLIETYLNQGEQP